MQLPPADADYPSLLRWVERVDPEVAAAALEVDASLTALVLELSPAERLRRAQANALALARLRGAAQRG